MKKIKVLFLTLICSPLIMGYTVDKQDVNITVGNVDVPVYNVEVSWGKMQFTYQETVNYIWDKNTNSYELSKSTYTWKTSSNTININNKSVMPVDIELKYLSEKETINGTFDIKKISVPADKEIESKLTLDGTLPSNNINYTKVGTINLLIS